MSASIPLVTFKCDATNRVELTAMMAFLKRMRWVALLACYVVIARTCRLFRIALPMDSFLASAQSEKIQAVFGSSAYSVLFPGYAAAMW
jgi:hypothetical protein